MFPPTPTAGLWRRISEKSNQWERVLSGPGSEQTGKDALQVFSGSRGEFPKLLPQVFAGIVKLWEAKTVRPAKKQGVLSFAGDWISIYLY
jgi:hypothetical protein